MRDILDLIVSELRGSWRYRWLAVVVAWLVCLGGWAFVYTMPDVYEAKATVLFETTSDLDELLESLTVNADLLSRVETVRTVLLGRPQLEKVARETDLYLRASSDGAMNSLISGLRSRITLESDRQRGSNIYEIGYRDGEPAMAYAVVNSLLNSFVEESLGANREGTQRAQEFLRQELANLEVDLEASEQRLADFKRENVGQMPGEQGDYFSRLQGEMEGLENTRSSLRLARSQQQTLKQQLAGEKPTMSGGAIESDLDVRIADNEKRLEDLQLRFTDRHPDIIAVKSTLQQLRQQQQSQIEELQASDGVSVTSNNPVFQNIQIELARVNVEISALQEQERTQLRKINELQGLVDILPQIEAELARLNRDYDVKLSQYNSLLQRLEIAELSESAEQSDQVDFQVIDPPLEPSKPVAPNRPLLLAAILFVGLGFGGGVAFLGNQLKPVFMDPRTLRQVVGLPLLGTVQILQTKERTRRRAAQLGAFASAIGILCLVFVFALLLQRPLGDLIRSMV